MSLFKTNKTENYSKLARVTNVYGGRNKLRKPKIKKKQSENKIITAIKDKMIRDIRNLSGQREEVYHKPVRVSNLYSNNFMEYENNSDKNKILLIKE